MRARSRPTSRRVARAVVGVALAVALGACGTDGDDSAGGDGATTTAVTTPPPTTSAIVVPATGETLTIPAIDNTFVPVEATIAAGTEVIWENRGRNDHNIIPEDPDAPWRIDADAFAPQDVSAGYVFSRPGTYRYYCSIHGTIDAGMPGVLIVEPPQT